MAKIGFFTDLHLRGQAFSSRKDDYPSAVIEKLRFCLKRCSDECDVIVFGGDFTDSHRLASDDTKEKAVSAFKECLRDDMPFLFTYGQHDLLGRSYDSRNDSTTAMIMRFALMLKKQVYELPVEGYLDVNLGNERLFFTACPSGVEPLAWFVRRASLTPAGGRSIAVVHHLLSDQEADWFVPLGSLVTKNPDGPQKIDLVLSGDLHDGYAPYVNQDKTLFLNPGSLGRTKKTKNDLARTVSGVTVDTETLKHETWPVTVARPAAEVFREDFPVDDTPVISAAAPDVKSEGNFDEVITRLASVSQRRVDFWDLLEKKAAETKLDQAVLDYIHTKRPST